MELKSKSNLQKFPIDKTNIDDFKPLPWRRKIYASQIKSILNQLKKGKHFDSPLVLILRTDGCSDIIDGNHRIEAIKKWIKEDNTRKISIDAHVYEDLIEDEKKELFNQWNKGKTQSGHDYVKVHSEDIHIFVMLEEPKFPTKIRIYSLQNREKGIPFRTLITTYLSAKANPNAISVYSGNGEKLVKDSKEIEAKTAYFELYRFVEIFQEAFGNMGKENKYQHHSLLYALMAIFLDNQELDDKKLIKAFEKILNAPTIKEKLIGAPSRQLVQDIYTSLTYIVNRKVKTNKLKLERT